MKNLVVCRASEVKNLQTELPRSSVGAVGSGARSVPSCFLRKSGQYSHAYSSIILSMHACVVWVLSGVGGEQLAAHKEGTCMLHCFSGDV